MQRSWRRFAPLAFVLFTGGFTGSLTGSLTGSFTGSAVASTVAAAEIVHPEAFLGHPVGADRKLARYDRVLEYLRLVDGESDRVTIETVGESTLGNEMVAVVLTASANQPELDTYRSIARRLAAADLLSPEETADLVDQGKAIVEAFKASQ